MRRLRERKGLALEEAGALVEISKAALSRCEKKERTVKWPAVDVLCCECGASGQVRKTLVELAKGSAHERGSPCTSGRDRRGRHSAPGRWARSHA
ncbi:helix-turn-helix transcriptional regulator [Streptomyces sp. NPDC006678]|uniref:helix-turn-helix domain-containing protein n=1 Tax=Streptomyces sp. NPDC006678 TaxID=3157185 RepID=UPI0033C9FF02